MATKTTTLAAIRKRMQENVLALNPRKRTGQRFELDRAEEPFRDWCERNAGRCFRHFAVSLEDPTGTPPAVVDQVIEERTATFELVVAYPMQWGKYGPENARSAEEVLEDDAQLIDGRNGIGINAAAGYVDGQSRAEVTWTIEPGDGVIFSVFTVEVTYRRSVAGS